MRTGGRPPRITIGQIERAGREMGLDGLTVQGVAQALGVTPAALYRHVDGRIGLETLVGESLLAELRIPDDPADDAAGHLLRFAAALRGFVLAHPGTAAYLQTLFPRGESGAALLAAEIDALGRRGYPPHLGSVLASSVAGLAVGRAAVEELHTTRMQDSPGLARLAERSRALHDGLIAAPPGLPEITMEDYFHMIMTACVRGLLAEVRPDRPIGETMAALGFDPHRER